MSQLSENKSLQNALSNLGAIFGTSNDDVQIGLLRQVVEALWFPLSEDEDGSRAVAALAVLHEMKPQDIFEGLLASQMVGTHNAAMECLKRAAEAGANVTGAEVNLRLASKFLAIYLQQLDGLNRHRGKGAPQVNVGAVNVQSGGQAIVGSVEAKPPRKHKRPAHEPRIPALTSSPVIPIGLGGANELIEQPLGRGSNEPIGDA
ncbi:hypothetical protein [Microvirga guangxiensis]|uniref:Uncharacterized protein n=1 Tax=Microvirga guangxiensis TaxID=549386 RepID=A0A1G5CDY9_9HYPH|nr:hypothetical protein [Microvirga guangxiensis]SCY00612.1 hypothetical protein SAMN02927923_00542 [Microvirga guangxiensis]